LREKDFKVAINSEYMETTPLGRTEWIKFIAAFFDKEDEAERLFADTAIRYANLTAMTRDVAQKPKVFCGSNYRGTWHMPGGNSYVARFLRDAGAAYLWEEDRGTGSTPLNIEAVLSRARHADYWLNPGVHRSREEIAAEDERYSVFPAFRAGRVYSDNAKMDAAGGNDIWETGVAYPDIVLADLISIFHPEILQDHRRTWYWQLPEKASERK
jgi:iron complex transport system substrate-binding protein